MANPGIVMNNTNAVAVNIHAVSPALKPTFSNDDIVKYPQNAHTNQINSNRLCLSAFVMLLS